MPKLRYHPGAPDERVFDLPAAQVVIGRDPSVAISIDDRSLSRQHATIEPEGGRFLLSDRGSKNGTFVNNVRVEIRLLHDGDTVRLGDVVLRFEDHEASPTSTVVTDPSTGTLDQLIQTQDKLAILLEASRRLGGAEDVDPLLGTILDLAFRIFDVDHGVILLVDAETGELVQRAGRSRAGGPSGAPVYSRSIVAQALAQNTALISADTAIDPRLAASRSIIAASIRASMCAPLRARDRTLGVLYVADHRGPREFTAEDLAFLAAFAGHAAIAVENAELRSRIERETAARVELAMEAKLSALGRLVSGLSHELNNPLNFIENFADSALELSAEIGQKLRDGEGAAEVEADLADLRLAAAKILEHGRRAGALVEGMTVHAHAASEPRAEADLNALLRQSVREVLPFGTAGAAAAVDVALDLDEAVGLVEVVRSNIQRVFTNVVTNARDAMLERKHALAREDCAYAPRLVVQSRSLGDRVEVRFTDNGAGMTDEVLGRAFEPFFTTKPTGKGTGLGLSLSREIVVDGHQGSIRATSEPGEGTIVVVSLPKKRARIVR
ncbi:MAG: ATP-binding protein [Byssovorax sp.]